MAERSYRVNGQWVDAEYFAATMSDLFAAGWKLVPPELGEERELDGRSWEWGNVTDESEGDAPKG